MASEPHYRFVVNTASDGFPVGSFEPVDIDAIVAAHCAPLVEALEALEAYITSWGDKPANRPPTRIEEDIMRLLDCAEALRELVALKDVAESTRPSDSKDDWYLAYVAAWERARLALGGGE